MEQQQFKSNGGSKKIIASIIILVIALVIALVGKQYLKTKAPTRPAESGQQQQQQTAQKPPVDPAACGEGTTFTNVDKLKNASAQICNLNLTDTAMAALPDFSRLGDLKRLNLSHDQMFVVPSDLGQLKSLIVLNLSNNKITSLPAEMSGLTNLSALDVSFNQITTLPESFSALANLKQLNLNNNKLAALPAVVAQMSGLVELDLNSNQLTKLPDSLKNLSIVNSDQAEGSKDGVSGTPTFYINGQQIVGAQPLTSFQAAIDAALK